MNKYLGGTIAALALLGGLIWLYVHQNQRIQDQAGKIAFLEARIHTDSLELEPTEVIYDSTAGNYFKRQRDSLRAKLKHLASLAGRIGTGSVPGALDIDSLIASVIDSLEALPLPKAGTAYFDTVLTPGPHRIDLAMEFDYPDPKLRLTAGYHFQAPRQRLNNISLFVGAGMSPERGFLGDLGIAYHRGGHGPWLHVLTDFKNWGFLTGYTLRFDF